jgi:hypothetical protein
MSLTPGQGHFGPDAIPVRMPLSPFLFPNHNPNHNPNPTQHQCQGDARWRRGESVSLKTARDSMTSLELAQHAQMVYSVRA